MNKCLWCGSEFWELLWNYCVICGLLLKEEKNNGNKWIVKKLIGRKVIEISCIRIVRV